jgi:hypothetical protein
MPTGTGSDVAARHDVQRRRAQATTLSVQRCAVGMSVARLSSTRLPASHPPTTSLNQCVRR